MRHIFLCIFILITFSLFAQVNRRSLIGYKRFNRKITLIDKNTIQFGSNTLFVINTNDALKDLFIKGIIYPEIFNETQNKKAESNAIEPRDSAVVVIKDSIFMSCLFSMDSLIISDFEQIEEYDQRPNVRTFSFLLFRKRFANPISYKVELINNEANKQTDILTFIKNAYILKLIAGSILI